MEIRDDKLELFLSKEFVDRGLKHGNTKKINSEALRILSDPKGRLVFADYMLQGRYKVAPPRICLIPKKEPGEFRKVYANEQFDRLVLSIIHEVYYHMYHHAIHPCCVSYQKGIGVRNIIQKITGQLKSVECKGYKADLSKYFDSVNKETLFAMLKELSTNSIIDQVVYDYYSDDHVIDEHGNVVDKYKSLAQGCALGAFLANYALRDIDQELSQLDIVYYRYSDDLLMIGKDADLAIQILQERLVRKGLKLNPAKIETISPEKPFVFLGIKICGDKRSFSDDSIERFKKKIKEITKTTKETKLYNRSAQRKAIRQINRYLYTDYLRNENAFGWFEYFTGICNQKEDYKMLDEYVKDHLKAMYTGKWNHTRNSHFTSNEDLKEMGYISMVHLYELYKINKEVYRAEIRRAI